MTHFSDSLHLGAAATGIVGNPNGSNTGGRGFGPIGRCYVYDIVPLTLSATALATSQTPGASAITLTAGTSVTLVQFAGQNRYTLDVPRTVTITSGGTDTGITFLVSGYDTYGVPMTERITGAAAGTATGKKAFASVISVQPSAAAASTVTVGTSDVLGLPVAVVDAAYIAHAGWNNTLADNAGTFTAAITTNPATATTGDVRGTYLPTPATNGTRRLVITIALSDLNIGGGQTIQGVVGVTQA